VSSLLGFEKPPNMAQHLVAGRSDGFVYEVKHVSRYEFGRWSAEELSLSHFEVRV